MNKTDQNSIEAREKQNNDNLEQSSNTLINARKWQKEEQIPSLGKPRNIKEFNARKTKGLKSNN